MRQRTGPPPARAVTLHALGLLLGVCGACPARETRPTPPPAPDQGVRRVSPVEAPAPWRRRTLAQLTPAAKGAPPSFSRRPAGPGGPAPLPARFARGIAEDGSFVCREWRWRAPPRDSKLCTAAGLAYAALVERRLAVGRPAVTRVVGPISLRRISRCGRRSVSVAPGAARLRRVAPELSQLARVTGPPRPLSGYPCRSGRIAFAWGTAVRHRWDSSGVHVFHRRTRGGGEASSARAAVRLELAGKALSRWTLRTVADPCAASSSARLSELLRIAVTCRGVHAVVTSATTVPRPCCRCQGKARRPVGPLPCQPARHKRARAKGGHQRWYLDLARGRLRPL